MNDILQHIGVLIFFLGAIIFLVKKFFWKAPKTAKKNAKSCGNDGCGCH